LRDKIFAVADSLGLSDSVLRDKIFAVADSLGLSDSVLRDKILTVSDSVGLADVPLKDWTPQITDAVALSDLILRDKAFSIHDSISLRGTVTPSIVGTSSVFTAISRPFQRKIFFANGLFWVFYSDGTNMVYRTSADGSTWSNATTVRADSNGNGNFSVWFDGTYMHYAWAYNSSLYYRRGTPNADSTITWSAVEQTVTTTYNSATFPFVSVDSDGYAWIGYSEASGGESGLPWVIKSGNNDGTWGTTPSGFPYLLNATDTYARVVAIPLTNDKMLTVYGKSGQTLKAESWDGLAWGTQVATASAVLSSAFFGISVQGDNAHLAFEDTAYNILYTQYSYSLNSFSSETTIQTEVTSESVPYICVNLVNGDLYIFWAVTNIYYSKYNGTSWESPVQWISGETLATNEKIGCFHQVSNGYIGVIYVTGTVSPYNVKFKYLMVEEAIFVNKTLIITDVVALAEIIEVITGAIIKYVTDTLGLSDAIKINKTFAVSDTLSLLDQVFRHKPQVSVADAVALAEVIVVSKLFTVADTINLSDVAYALKQLHISDSIALSDAIEVITGAIIKYVTDTLGLSDQVKIDKIFIISDTLSLLDQIFRDKPVSITDIITLLDVIEAYYYKIYKIIIEMSTVDPITISCEDI